MLITLDQSGKAINLGRRRELLQSVQGIGSGPGASYGLLTLTTDRRFHRLRTRWKAVNYTGSTTAQTCTKVTSTSGAGLTGTLTVTAYQVPLAFTVTAGGTGWTTGDTFTIADATGTGAIFTATASAGAVTSAVYVANSATASPIHPGLVCGRAKIAVSGTIIRDITSQYTIMIAQANKIYTQLGELIHYFTEPNQNLTRAFSANSWDMFGQKNFTITYEVNSGYLLPSVDGVMEYDFQRNSVMNGNTPQPSLDPISYKAYTFNLASGVQTIPLEWQNNVPIRRLWIAGATPGQITQIELSSDGNKIEEGFVDQINKRLQEDGFDMGEANYLNQTQTAQKTLGLNPISYFDTAVVFDGDQRYEECLKTANGLNFKLWSNIAQNVTIIAERAPGYYAQ